MGIWHPKTQAQKFEYFSFTRINEIHTLSHNPNRKKNSIYKFFTLFFFVIPFFLYQRPELGGEYSQTTSVCTSLLWKFLWQPQAAHVRASPVLAINSLQPSTAYPPILAAWFFWHSPYLIFLITEDEVLAILFNTTCLFFMLTKKTCNISTQLNLFICI